MKQTQTFTNMKLPQAIQTRTAATPGRGLKTNVARGQKPAFHPGLKPASHPGPRPHNVRNQPQTRYPERMNRTMTQPKAVTPILRRELGEVLRELRQTRGLTLRDVSAKARVSLGYLSEVERGQKEASSELLTSICYALDAPVAFVLHEVADRIAELEGLTVPESVPDGLLESVDCAPVS